jgi:Domain of unknown function (DUF4037)
MMRSIVMVSVDEWVRGVVGSYAAWPAVEAVALGGSRVGPLETGDDADVDLYVYRRGALSLAERAKVPGAGAHDVEIGNTFWEDGDEWLAPSAPVAVDVMFRDVAWIEDEIARVADRHEARLGYSTCLLYNVRACRVLFDRAGWLAALKARASAPYPDALRDAILAKNHPVLRRARSAYLRQVERAVARDDRFAVQHRVTALLASYFDVLFAANAMAHPGEKRLVELAVEWCPSSPDRLAEDVHALLAALAVPGDEVLRRAGRLLDALDAWLEGRGQLPPWPSAPAPA